MSGETDAQDQVFGIQELADIIMDMVLQQADVFELFRYQAVSKHVRHKIRTNKVLSERMFLRAEPAEVIANTSSRDRQTVKQLREANLNPYVALVCRTPTPVEADPKAEFRDLETLAIPTATWSKEHHFISLRAIDSESTAITNPKSSWRSMYLTQPPSTDICIFMPKKAIDETLSHNIDSDTMISNPAGVTLGEIVDTIKAYAVGSKYLQGAPFSVALLAIASYERTYSTYFRELQNWHREWHREERRRTGLYADPSLYLKSLKSVMLRPAR